MLTFLPGLIKISVQSTPGQSPPEDRRTDTHVECEQAPVNYSFNFFNQNIVW